MSSSEVTAKETMTPARPAAPPPAQQPPVPPPPPRAAGDGRDPVRALAAEPLPPPPHRPRRAWPWVLLLVALAAGAGYWLYARQNGSKADAAGPDPSKRTVPVIAATARTANLRLYLNGLGTVTPLNTV